MERRQKLGGPGPCGEHSVDLEGPWDAARIEDTARRLAPAGGLAWLDGEAGDRYTYLCAGPIETLRVAFGEDPREAMKRIESGFWVGYKAYDAAWSTSGLEGRGEPRHARGEDVIAFRRYAAWVRVDHQAQSASASAETKAALDALMGWLSSPPPALPQGRVGEATATAGSGHIRAIESAKKAIAAGDVYQVNLARTWRAPFEGEALALWFAMRRASPVPLGFYLDMDDHQVIARTMECFLRWSPDEHGEGRLETRPIKGTIPRRGDDAAEAETLRTDPKEHAEHVMIVDLLRNDLSRVAKVGSVRVERALEVETYAKLSHLVSTIACETRRDTTLQDVLEATFPPGSVTGAPKVRAVKLIEALEPEVRGVYCGAVGFVAGGASFAVAIRTAVVRENEVVYRAGGGLVAASDPPSELAETDLKARVFLDALVELADLNTPVA